MFGHGLDYRKALSDFTKVAGKITMPPRFSFGVFYSRWWPYSDTEAMDIISEYQSYSIPLDGTAAHARTSAVLLRVLFTMCDAVCVCARVCVCVCCVCVYVSVCFSRCASQFWSATWTGE
jgi:hypothetical protein